MTPGPYVVALGVTIRRFRKERNLTLVELADPCGISLGALSAIERAKTSPSIHVVVRLASALKLHPSELLARAEQVLEEKQ